MIIDPKDVNKVLLPRLLTLVTCNDSIGGIDAIPSDTIIPVSSNPSIVVITVSPSFKIFKNILNKEEFVINILSKDYVDNMLGCLKNYPMGINKIEQAGLNHYSSEKVESKRVKEAKVWIECKLINKMKVDDNMLLFGRVVAIEADEDVIVNGQVDVTKINPPIRISESSFSGVQK